MPTPIYLRKSGETRVKLHALVQTTQAAGSTLEFQCAIYLPVDSQSHYYLTRRAPDEGLGLWLVELHCSDASQEPYHYTGVLSRKCRDLPEGWIGDD